MKIGIYGGTFDPPHLGHMQAARAAIEQLGLDLLLLIPARIPPHKSLPTDGAGPADRIAMATRMAGGLGKRVEVLDLELQRDGKSYTVDTLETLKSKYPQAQFYLLVGSDMFFSLQDWYQPQRVMAMVEIATFSRAQGDDAGFDLQCERLSQQYGVKICRIALEHIVEISSTQLRTALAQGQGMEFLWPQVYGYILKQGLYATHADLKQLSDQDLRAVSWSMVRAKRIPHIKGTEQEAVRLARRWGANPNWARRAAILHDCTKYLTMDEQLHLCDQYDILLDDLEQVAVKLLHAKTGAALARNVFGQPEEICQAIYWHTTGKVGMSTLEKVLYLADYMEPTRDFDGVEELRALAYLDLDRAIALGFSMTVEEMTQRGVPIHANTLAALADLKGN